VVKPAQEGCGCDPAPRLTFRPGTVLSEAIRDLLPDALMGSGSVVVLNIGLHDTMQLAAMQNEHVVQAFPPQAANEALTE